MSPYRLLSHHGIKGPRPLPIAGNFLRIQNVKTAFLIAKKFKGMFVLCQIGHMEFLKEQIKKFGPIFG